MEQDQWEHGEAGHYGREQEENPSQRLSPVVSASTGEQHAADA